MTHAIDEPDAWTLGSYRRLDALKVPAFSDRAVAAPLEPRRASRVADILPLETRLRRSVLPFTDFLRGQTAPGYGALPDALSLLLRYLAAPLRFEPQNPYLVHNAVPSPRSLFPCKLVVVVAGGDSEDSARAYRYHPHHHGLEIIRTSPALRRLLGKGDVAVVGIGQYWMIAEKYGDYSPFLVCLEAGMLKAQLEHLARLVGWSLQATEMDGRAWNAALGCRKLETTLFGIVASVRDRSAPLSRGRPTRLAAWDHSDEGAERFPKLTRIVDLFGVDDRPPASVHERIGDTTESHVANPASGPASADTRLDVLEVMRRRTSGNDSGGFAPAGRWPDDTLLERLLTAWRALGAQRPPAPGAENLTTYIAWFGPSNPPVGLYTTQLVRQPLPLDDVTFVQTLQRALPPAFRYNIPAFTMSVLLMAAVPAARATHGAHALRRVHLAAGATAQDFCLAAAAEGLFARPTRMFQEIEIETAWRLPGQLIYQVLVGFNRRTNVALELL